MTTKNFQIAASMVMVSLAVCVLVFGLLPALLAGTLLYLSICWLEGHLPTQLPNRRLFALGIAVLAFAALLAAIGFASSKFLGLTGVAGMLLKISNILDQLRVSVPDSWQGFIPEGVEQLKSLLAAQIKVHASSVTQISMHGFHQMVHIILATIVACLIAATGPIEANGALSAPIYRHILNFADAVAKVFGAQLKIALINTLITGTFLLVVLPRFGYHLPFADIATVLTFIFGLIPVVGNLVTNSINVLLALSVGPWLAVTCLGFLVVSHKIEYLLCAKFVGEGVGAKTWELLTAMLLLESIFGPIGFAAAPVLYAWLKAELRIRMLL